MHGTEATFALPTFTAPPPFDPYATLSRMAGQKEAVLRALAAERASPRPSAAVIESCEVWLRVFNRESLRLARFSERTAPRGTQNGDDG